MQELQILLFIFGIIGYVVTSSFAITAYSILRHQNKNILVLLKESDRMLMITMADHIRNNFNQINALRSACATLIRYEKYEEAEKMKTFIDTAEKSAFKSLHDFREIYGDDACKMIITDPLEM